MDENEVTLDDIDRGILHQLQQDARNNTTREIGEAVGVSAGTVRNRLEKLEEANVIRSYLPEINYERAGYQLVMLFTCTAAEPDDSIAADLLEIHGVVSVRKLLAGTENYHVTVVGSNTDEIATVANAVRNCGLEVVRSDVMDTEHQQPFNHFGREISQPDI
ncbi:AsnC family transcriptional regulator [Natronolimnobius sp. AArcel1]|uniref:Lrp/AsnC family transcriptional regulator n=1 Tax=Natronolimnobius sp. AArcel1 TaxID=1679093 RepID=UPI0013EB00F5|nr:winged helix-turn-helix transcriptional regulator [Natronolimnobius sp. AArcel1]NGM69721.1 AsnC family transcriptional regulator [Natronolimnobius sp. AArcel1]